MSPRKWGQFKSAKKKNFKLTTLAEIITIEIGINKETPKKEKEYKIHNKDEDHSQILEVIIITTEANRE